MDARTLFLVAEAGQWLSQPLTFLLLLTWASFFVRADVTSYKAL